MQFKIWINKELRRAYDLVWWIKNEVIKTKVLCIDDYSIYAILYKSLGHSTNDEHKKTSKKFWKSTWRNELNLIE